MQIPLRLAPPGPPGESIVEISVATSVVAARVRNWRELEEVYML